MRARLPAARRRARGTQTRCWSAPTPVPLFQPTN